MKRLIRKEKHHHPLFHDIGDGAFFITTYQRCSLLNKPAFKSKNSLYKNIIKAPV